MNGLASLACPGHLLWSQNLDSYLTSSLALSESFSSSAKKDEHSTSLIRC